MAVNKKKALRLKNNTKYFNPLISRTHNRFRSPNSYQSRRIKIEGYESRLYWQYRYCDEHNGQSFFYTLTYNDAAMPKYLEQNCFDYEDLRDLLTGGFRKKLLRNYGTTFKYFIGAELGDGKGERGLQNNPHYHIIFFLEDAKNERYPYVKISPEDFRHLVRMYWQGFDEDEDEKNGVFHDYRDAKYGISCEGENCGLIVDFCACMYCAKYVCKDVKLKKHEKKVESALRLKYKKDIVYDTDFNTNFMNEYLCIRYMDADTGEIPSPEALALSLLGDDYEFVYLPDWLDENKGIEWYFVVQDIIQRYPELMNEYYVYLNECTNEKVRLGMNEYRNRYCNKCRISQGVGDYALEFIDDKLNPSIQIPKKKGFKKRPISMYYYRKLYYDVVKDENSQNLYVLNSLGREYKVARLPEQIEKLSAKAKSYLDIVIGNPELFEKMRESDINTEVRMHFTDFFERWGYLLLEKNKNKIDEITKKYAEFKLVYEDRFFSVESQRNPQYGYFPPIDIVADYSRFIIPAYFTTTRSDYRLSAFLDRHDENWVSYYAHPYFLRYVSLFSVLDLCTDYFFVQEDNRQQKEAEERAAVRRFHDKQKLVEFYSRFSN